MSRPRRAGGDVDTPNPNPSPSPGTEVPAVDGMDRGTLVVEERFSIVPEWVLDADVSDAAVRLYAVLLRFGNTSGQRMPSRRTLAGRLRKKSTDSVDRAMKELVGIGAVEVHRRSRGGVNLTNRYVVRSTRPGGRGLAAGRAGGAGEEASGGGRIGAATPPVADPAGGDRAGACRVGGTRDVERTNDVTAGGGGRGGRTGAARGGRRVAAGVAASVRPDRESSTETPPPPGPSSPAPTAGSVGRGAARADRAERRGRLAALLPGADLDDVARRCVVARRRLRQGTALWSVGRVAEVLADAVLDGGWPAEAAVPALLAVAADPATRSPARVCCPGPWWDAADAAGLGWASEGVDEEIAGLEARLAETDGRRVVLQQRARAELAAEGQPVTRAGVVRRAVQILDRGLDEGGGVLVSAGPATRP